MHQPKVIITERETLNTSTQRTLRRSISLFNFTTLSEDGNKNTNIKSRNSSEELLSIANAAEQTNATLDEADRDSELRTTSRSYYGKKIFSIFHGKPSSSSVCNKTKTSLRRGPVCPEPFSFDKRDEENKLKKLKQIEISRTTIVPRFKARPPPASVRRIIASSKLNSGSIMSTTQGGGHLNSGSIMSTTQGGGHNRTEESNVVASLTTQISKLKKGLEFNNLEIAALCDELQAMKIAQSEINAKVDEDRETIRQVQARLNVVSNLGIKDNLLSQTSTSVAHQNQTQIVIRQKMQISSLLRKLEETVDRLTKLNAESSPNAMEHMKTYLDLQMLLESAAKCPQELEQHKKWMDEEILKLKDISNNAEHKQILKGLQKDLEKHKRVLSDLQTMVVAAQENTFHNRLEKISSIAESKTMLKCVFQLALNCKMEHHEQQDMDLKKTCSDGTSDKMDNTEKVAQRRTAIRPQPTTSKMDLTLCYCRGSCLTRKCICIRQSKKCTESCRCQGKGTCNNMVLSSDTENEEY